MGLLKSQETTLFDWKAYIDRDVGFAARQRVCFLRECMMEVLNWTTCLASGTASGFLVWLFTVMSLENSWLRITSSGNRQWMIHGILRKFLTQPLMSRFWRLYWTDAKMAMHNVYLMCLSGFVFGIIVAIVRIAIQRRDD